MPYKPFLEGGKQAVYAVDASGKKMGKRRGLHDTMAEAKTQIAAIMASEKKPKKELQTSFDPHTTFVNDEEVSIASLSAADDAALRQAQDAALKELHEKMGYYEAEMMPMAGPTSFADLMAQEAAQEAAHEIHELTYNFSTLARNIMAAEMDDKGGALTALANEYAGLVQDKLKSEMADKSISVAEQIAGDNQPRNKNLSTSQTTDQTPDSTNDPGGDSGNKDTQNLFIWKEGDTYRWIAAYSNNRRDDDNPPEIISSESHKEFDAALHKGEWPMPELWLWHIDYPVGITQYHAYDESAGFPVAAGVFNKGCEWAAEGVIDAGWNGVSHGMPSPWIKRDEKDNSIIIRHRTKEITFLPPWAAANKLAFNIINKESDMAEEKGLPAHKRDEFIKAFGEEQVTKIETALEGKAKEADDAGIEKKEQTEAAPEPVTGVTHKEIAEVLAVIKETFEKFDNRLKELEEQKPTEQKEDVSFDLVALLKQSSAIGKAETKVDGRSTLAKDAPEEAQPESYTEKFSGIRVSLVDQLVGANQAYYENRR